MKTRPVEALDWESFEEDLTELINMYALEVGSNTPDYVIAKYLVGCLKVFNEGVNSRDSWNGILYKAKEE